ncbi:MAG: hypothetical protein ACK5MZ_00230 [Aestuariibaculum sp.]
MKKLIHLLPILFVSLIVTGCSDDSASDEFENANGNTVKKLIKTIVFTDIYSSEEETVTFTYNSNGTLNTVSNDDNDTVDFAYSDNDLSNISDGTEIFDINELFQSPYDVFEKGDVLEYDENGNPSKVAIYSEEQEWNNTNQNYDYYQQTYTAEITYDNTPNPYYYTLEAAGIIDVLDRVELNLSINPQVPEIIKARTLFFVNNPKKIVFKDEDGIIESTLSIDYVYDNDNYPMSAVGKVEYYNSNGIIEADETENYTAVYTYVE